MADRKINPVAELFHPALGARHFRLQMTVRAAIVRLVTEPNSIEEFLIFAERLADAARQETLPRFRKGAQVFNKAGIWFDPVTDADREAERIQRRMINAVYPKHGIIGEEFGAERDDADLQWVLDPVDGTRAFVCGVPSWATLIALEENGKPILSVIDQPFTDERWCAGPKGSFYRRGETMTEARTSSVTSLAKARLSTTDPRRMVYFSNEEADAFQAVASKAQVTRFSLDAYAYALVASGELDLVIESSLKHHDFSALVPIVRGAGGVITNWKGRHPGSDEEGRIVAAATPELHAEALAILSQVSSV